MSLKYILGYFEEEEVVMEVKEGKKGKLNQKLISTNKK
jgi:hypothetical protein